MILPEWGSGEYPAGMAKIITEAIRLAIKSVPISDPADLKAGKGKALSLQKEFPQAEIIIQPNRGQVLAVLRDPKTGRFTKWLGSSQI